MTLSGCSRLRRSDTSCPASESILFDGTDVAAVEPKAEEGRNGLFFNPTIATHPWFVEKEVPGDTGAVQQWHLRSLFGAKYH